MDGDPTGKLYGLVSVTGSYFDPVCNGGCLLQRIDVLGRSVEAQATLSPALGRVVAFRHDPYTGGVVLGYRLASDDRDEDLGYRVAQYSF